MERTSLYREIVLDRSTEFHRKGYKRRFFFPHRFYYLPKIGPDGVKLATQMCPLSDLNQMWEIILYADRSMIEEFPQDLFFDDDIIWHQQQFGRPGQVATANLLLSGNTLYSMVHISDLVQRISRRKEHRTRIENKFRGWNFMLLNAILNFASERRVNSVYLPTAASAHRNTDPKRKPEMELFHRIYDRNVLSLFRVTQNGDWWKLELSDNLDKLVVPEKRTEKIPRVKSICLCHDVEAGYGHTEVDPAFSEKAAATSRRSLDRMLSIENQLGVSATYNILGLMFEQVRPRIGKEHCIAFHSYDHRTDEKDPEQLEKCRSIDYRIKGYRPPQSRITNGLSDQNLAYHNFEWLASSAWSLGIRRPQIQNRIVKIPIHFDDYELYRSGMRYSEWEERAWKTIAENDFVAFSLHDCYAPFWLPNYAEFLQKILALGSLQTMNRIASEEAFSIAG
jgi:hypothetical protein